ncbi:MAG: hypothetical protein JXR46_05825 [Calditrichaceae bacterium]|nr:hypothetical protein [Calditrichaceae bacterium]MBN2708543.1 hypothetical protein [Calditrichaceae bacterium]RQV93498.1 MAG: hypothetical protein EH224_12435 [Calditrichota bacterium]
MANRNIQFTANTGTREFISFHKEMDLEEIKKTIGEEYPNLSEDVINGAILSCFSSIPPPRPRELFMDCLRRRLSF